MAGRGRDRNSRSGQKRVGQGERVKGWSVELLQCPGSLARHHIWCLPRRLARSRLLKNVDLVVLFIHLSIPFWQEDGLRNVSPLKKRAVSLIPQRLAARLVYFVLHKHLLNE